MKIYTKKGDEGQTSLFGGHRVPKHHLRIDAYGTVDELNSWIGFLRDQPEGRAYSKILVEIQDRLFTLGAELASDKENAKIPRLSEPDVTLLENSIDAMDATLPEMKNFVLPGGHPVISQAHIARCVCRRAERLVSLVAESNPVDPLILKYLNRLSDYLFVLSRRIGADVKAEEIPWKPRH